METVEQKYADLLLNYCLEIKKGESLIISTTYEGQPLLKEVYRQAVEKGAMVEVLINFPGKHEILMKYAEENTLDIPPPFLSQAMADFDNYLVIKAPYNLRETGGLDPDRVQRRQKAMSGLNENYFKRTASGEMKRSLCEYPTQASAQNAGMSLDEFRKFVFDACRLNESDPTAAWLKVREEQQKIVDVLNSREIFQYKGPNIDIEFSAKDRVWINSDGTANMPSGEVFTAPVEDQVNGYVKFSYPAIYMGEEVEDVELWVEKGKIIKWNASKGKDFLDRIFKIPGTRRFGEVAVGTNYQIQQMTKNILFDEKIGGTIHMAIGQSYLQNGGKNQSSVHWDMITDMTKDSFIKADGEVIYKNGKFII